MCPSWTSGSKGGLVDSFGVGGGVGLWVVGWVRPVSGPGEDFGCPLLHQEGGGGVLR